MLHGRALDLGFVYGNSGTGTEEILKDPKWRNQNPLFAWHR